MAPPFKRMLVLMRELGSDDAGVRAGAEDAIRELGAKAIGSLRSGTSRRNLPRAEIYRMLGEIGDTAQGKAREKIVATMQTALSDTFDPRSEEAKAHALAALERWGAPPHVTPGATRPKPRCGRRDCSTPEHEVIRCFLPGCKVHVCRAHSVTFDIPRSPRFCSVAHRDEAARNPSILM